MKPSLRTLPLILVLVLLAACNMPGRRTPTPSGFELINTAAARTVEAQLTEISRPPAATGIPTQTGLTPGSPIQATNTPATAGFPTAIPSPAPALTVVPQPTQAPPATACDRARFVKDVTIPDNSVLQPGTSFTKTWRLKNVGDCAWNEDYRVVFVSGERLGSTGTAALPEVVEPDETVDVSVEMAAPSTGGVFRSEWKLSNAAGQVFGTGKNGDQPIWAQIRVAAPGGDAGRQYDFVSRASSAAWYSAAGDSAGLPLAFNGAPDSPNGAAILADGLRLETGQTSGKALLMIPKPQNEGYVYGIFPAYRVTAGDRFKARAGLAASPGGGCGAGRVVFQIAIKQGEDIDTMLEAPATCDGALTPLEVDLSDLAGQTVEFILVVRAPGAPSNPGEDWAVWNSPQITND